MAMEVKETRMFNFTSTVDGIPYGFNIAGESRAEAAGKLQKVLQVMLDDIGAVLKAGTKPN